jgi:hypothetical protein
MRARLKPGVCQKGELTMAGALVAERPQNRANDMFASVNFWPAGGVATRRQTTRLADDRLLPL